MAACSLSTHRRLPPYSAHGMERDKVAVEAIGKGRFNSEEFPSRHLERRRSVKGTGSSMELQAHRERSGTEQQEATEQQRKQQNQSTMPRLVPRQASGAGQEGSACQTSACRDCAGDVVSKYMASSLTDGRWDERFASKSLIAAGMECWVHAAGK